MAMTAETVAHLPTIETILGTIAVPDEPEDLLVRFLRHHGEWAWTEAEIAGTLIDRGACVLDGGACLGTFGLALAGLKQARIVAVEPDAVSHGLLTRNLAENCVTPWATVHAAIGRCTGKASVVSSAAGNRGATAFGEGGGTGAPPLLTLKSLRPTHGDPDLVKLDLEGGEFDALAGDAVWLKATRTPVWAECNEGREAFRLLEFCTWAGLTPVYVAWPACRPDAFRNGDDPLLPGAYEAALTWGDGVEERLAPLASRDDLIMRRIGGVADLRRAMWLTPRGGVARWSALSRPELLALAGRLADGEDFARWLLPDQEYGSSASRSASPTKENASTTMMTGIIGTRIQG